MKKPLLSLDLNLPPRLQFLTQELSVTRTAKWMNVSPSAVSKLLAKLRAWFDDPLSVKVPLGLAPTPLVSSMRQDLADWMQMGNQILDKPHHTMPSGLKFELATETPLLMILFNTLSQRIHQRYPQALIRLCNWGYDSSDAITHGEANIGFCGHESHPQSWELLSLLPWYIDLEVLLTDLPQAWLYADHSALREEWDLAAFLRHPHITICWERRDIWTLDDVLQELGYKHNVTLTVPGFEQSLFMVAQPQHTMLATVPRYCQHYNQQYQPPLVSRSLPLEAQHLEKLCVSFTLLWHKHNSYNPKFVWLRDTLKALYSGTLQALFRVYRPLFAQELAKFKQIPFSRGDSGIKTC